MENCPFSADRPESKLYEGLDGDRDDPISVADAPLLLAPLDVVLVREQPHAICGTDVALEVRADGGHDEVIGILRVNSSVIIRAKD